MAIKLLYIDLFCGAGGTSTGVERAQIDGRKCAKVIACVNHDANAILSHAANHPHTRHFCESVWEVNPRDIVGDHPVDLCWFSPDCKHFSKAKGNVPVSKEIRGLAWVALRYAATVRPRVIMLENVEEFVTWGPVDNDGQPIKEFAGQTFELWVSRLKKAGYKVSFFTNQFASTSNQGTICDLSGGFFLNDKRLARLQYDHRNERMYKYDGDLVDKSISMIKWGGQV